MVLAPFERYAARRALLVVMPSPHRAVWYQRRARLQCCPMVAMNAPLRTRERSAQRMDELRSRYGWDASRKVVLYQGAVNDGHALHALVASVPQWPSECVLLLCGYIWEDTARRLRDSIEQLGIRGRVGIESFPFYGQMNTLTPGAFLGAALFDHLTVNNQFMAGASNKMTEYIAAGVPLLVNDTAPNHEVFADGCAYYARQDDPFSIAQAVRQACEDPQGYARRAQECLRLHQTTFNYEAQFTPVISFLRQKL